MSQTSKTEDPIDLKEIFFSLIAQWKLIVLCILISLVCALIYLRITPNTYSVDALVQVEDSKGAASAALLGELSKTVGIEQKSPADAEIQILSSRMVLSQVIHNLNLDITIKNHDDTFFNRLLNQDKQNIDYKKDAVTFSNKDSY
ncbi:Wzz/FepE/Etk N-terminal domain-containing protein, partial [Acinetobacter baumannii]